MFYRYSVQSVKYRPIGDATSAAFLRPLPDERLELVIWGADEDRLRQAARMAPIFTGAGQPDLVIFGKSAAWDGFGGVLAIGIL